MAATLEVESTLTDRYQCWRAFKTEPVRVDF